jgi:hypothetical protein
MTGKPSTNGPRSRDRLGQIESLFLTARGKLKFDAHQWPPLASAHIAEKRPPTEGRGVGPDDGAAACSWLNG